MESAMRPEQIAHAYGYKYSFVDEGCKRAPDHHPIPHIARGGKRPVRYIRPSTFEKWLGEEERLTVGLPMEDELARDKYQEELARAIAVYTEAESA